MTVPALRATYGSASRHEAAMRFVEELVSEPRADRVAAFGDDAVLLGVSAPTLDNALVPTLLCYARGPGATWRPVWTMPYADEAVRVDGGFVCVRRRNGQSLVLRGVEGPERVLYGTTGRVLGLAERPGTSEVACLVGVAGRHAPRAHGAFAGSDAVWSDGSEISLGAARRPLDDWRVLLVPTDAAAEPREVRLEVPPGRQLTGEVAWAGEGTLLLGMYAQSPGGVRSFSLLAVPADGNRPGRPIDFDGLDLCYPVQHPEGRSVAYLGTSVPSGDEPPRQIACVLDSETWELRRLAAPDGLWQRPAGWSGAGRLVCTAEDGPLRSIHVHDLDSGRRSVLRVPGSVLDLRVRGGGVAVLSSTPDEPPVLDVMDLGGAAVERVETTRMPERPGRAVYRPQRVAGVEGRLASWLCLPEDAPARGTVVFFHGGPFKSWTEWSWRWNPWPFVARGYAVALVEPPLSLGYGDAVTAGWRVWRTGIAAAAAEQVRLLRAEAGLEDTGLALMGGSFGGYLALATAAELRPRLVAAHAAPLDFVQVAGGSDVGWQWVREYGDLVDREADYRAQSLPRGPVPPGTRVLLSHGVHDGLVPPTETLRTHRLLLSEGARSEAAFFPTEAHPLSRPGNVRAWYRWALTACAEEFGREADAGEGP
ncbi:MULTISPECIES: prolyl oligopeptidase family serine peptidase [unclassified Streptomyces]|uniref:S9 family peptidase n=1 Tax=unclassified Streptomyces TaxID=2593676 RepID=UPI000A3084F6|nr:MULTISPECIES: prolyl oligopeptidase family serine peptidase [unclassified Streptomyces]MYY04304.1 prolyl oligopeptidase family serine peptidase [Streptomyces sp. SID4913]